MSNHQFLLRLLRTPAGAADASVLGVGPRPGARTGSVSCRAPLGGGLDMVRLRCDSPAADSERSPAPGSPPEGVSKRCPGT
jgi:hypothetical protein